MLVAVRASRDADIVAADVKAERYDTPLQVPAVWLETGRAAGTRV
jgi:hypothetical protein